MNVSKRTMKRVQRQALRGFSPRFNRRMDHLKRMMRVNAPPVILIGSAESVCREYHSGHWGYFLHVAGDLFWHCLGHLIWYCRAASWKLRWPHKTIEQITEERYSQMVDEHNAECERIGDPEFKA